MKVTKQLWLVLSILMWLGLPGCTKKAEAPGEGGSVKGAASGGSSEPAAAGARLRFAPRAGAWIVPDGWRGGAPLEHLPGCGATFYLTGVNTGTRYMVSLELTGRKIVDGRVRVRVVFGDRQTAPAWAIAEEVLEEVLA